MVNHLHTISQAAYFLLWEKYNHVFRALDKQLNNDNRERMDEDGMANRDAVGEDKQQQWRHPAEKEKDELDSYLKELPVLGFNSGKYDVNLVTANSLQVAMTERLQSAQQ